jgi:hypothetical protein
MATQLQDVERALESLKELLRGSLLSSDTTVHLKQVVKSLEADLERAKIESTLS